MNKTFKVARSLTRGTVVTSEVASSYQGKTLKTVIAATVASLVAGMAMATESNDAPKLNNVDITTGTVSSHTYDVMLPEKLVDKLNVNGAVTFEGYNDAYDLQITGGEVVIKGDAEREEWDGAGLAGYGAVRDGGTDKPNENGTVIQNAKITLDSATLTAGSAGEGVKSEMAFKNSTLEFKGTEKMAGVLFTSKDVDLSFTDTVVKVAEGQFGTINVRGEENSSEDARMTVQIDGGAFDVQGTLAVTVFNKGQNTEIAFNDRLADEQALKDNSKFSFAGTQITVGKAGKLWLYAFDLTDGANAVVEGEMDGTEAVIDASRVSIAKGGDFDVDSLTIKNGGQVVNAGYLAVSEDLTIKDGLLETGYNWTKAEGDTDYKTDFTVGGAVNLEKGGTLKFSTLNSNENNGRMVLNDGTWNLNGGVLAAGSDEPYTGEIKIGRSSSSARVTIGGDYQFSKISFGSSNKANNQSTLDVDGTLTVGTLDFTTGKVTVSGKLDAGKLVWDKGTNTFKKEGSLEVKSTGTLVTAGLNNLFTIESTGEGEDATSTLKATSALNKLTLDGKLELDDSLTLELQDAKSYQSAVNKLLSDKTVILTGLTIKAAEGAESNTPSFGDVADMGLAGMNTVVSAGESKDGVVTIANNANSQVGIGGFSIDGNTKTVKVESNTNGLLVRGDKNNNGQLFSSNVESFDVNGALALGYDAGDSVIVNADKLTVGTLSVVGNVVANEISVTGADSSVSTDATLSTSALSSGSLAVSGVLNAQTIGKDATVTVNKSGVAVLRGTVEGAVATDVTTTLALTPEQLENLEQNKYISTNANVKTILAGSVFAKDVDGATAGVLYIDDTIQLGEKGKVNVGGTEAEGSLTVGNNALVVVDASKFVGSQESIIEGEVTVAGGTVALINTNSLGDIAIASGEVTATGATIKTDNNFVKAEYVAATTGVNAESAKFALSVDETFVGKDLAGAVTQAFGNSKNGEVFRAIGNNFAGDQGLTEVGQYITEEYLATPVVAGTYNVAYDAAEQLNGALARRNIETTTGMGVWADVFYSANQAKKIYGGQGYSADIYGGVLGFDTVFDCGAKLGAALTIGTGDADSERSVSKFSNDADFYGLSVYTGKHVGDTSLYLSADASYLWVENDIGGSVAGVSVAESIDSNVFTIGARADWNVYSGDMFKVVPHIGVRYTSIDVDDYRDMASDSMNIVEMPIGIKVAGDFEAAGWKVTPAFDFTVVPQVGDKKVETLVGDVDVINNLYNAALGVEATSGNFAFGLNYKHGFGREDRSNNSVNANVRYTF